MARDERDDCIDWLNVVLVRPVDEGSQPVAFQDRPCLMGGGE